jgi:hypothetical protein
MPRRKPGLKPKPAAERKRHRVNVMLTDDEVQRLRAWARDEDQNMGTLAREIVVRALNRRPS